MPASIEHRALPMVNSGIHRLIGPLSTNSRVTAVYQLYMLVSYILKIA